MVAEIQNVPHTILEVVDFLKVENFEKCEHRKLIKELIDKIFR